MITSTSNPLVRDLVRLRNRRHRDAESRFVIEGRRPLTLAGEAGVELQQQVVCRELGGRPVEGVPVVEMAEAPFRKASIRQNPDGVLAIAAHLDTTLGHLRLGAMPLVLVVESIEKPGNLGAMLRTSDALGVDAVVVADPTTDLHNPNVVQASQGALFTVPVAVAPTAQVLDWLGETGIRLIATVPGSHRAPWHADLAPPAAVAIGAEDTGLSQEMISAADETVTIPMEGQVDSLNASAAAAIVLYEAVRRRRQG